MITSLVLYKGLSRIYGFSRLAEGLMNKKFRTQKALFQKLAKQAEQRFSLNLLDTMPCLEENTAVTGFDRHYIYHPAWAARILAKINPRQHVDVSSSLHFCSMISAFINTRFYDYRPANLQLSNLSSDAADLLSLPFESGTIESLSCMHVVEHIGLGRYGDPLDYDGDLKAAAELERVLAPGGNFLFVVPVGRSRIMFNAHRIYSFEQVISLFPNLSLKSFSLVSDDPALGIMDNPEPLLVNKQDYGCGCFWFSKRRG